MIASWFRDALTEQISSKTTIDRLMGQLDLLILRRYFTRPQDAPEPDVGAETEWAITQLLRLIAIDEVQVNGEQLAEYIRTQYHEWENG